ncbi:MAG TPA: tRNA pseudouridine(55) synthase TruB [Flavobacteriaceae bacterium]|nr:tRNA pseudouridine(55) synthase TruB [Flavobacteriaceae bacterium]
MTPEQLQKGQVFLFDKPLGWTSFQLVNKVRWLLRKKFNLKKIKVGHAGTLDPLATGLLIICVGKETKNIHLYQAAEKEYIGTFTLGATTPSFDLETEIDQSFDISTISDTSIFAVAKNFIGEIQQRPPVYSAIKKDGKRLYEHARKGEEIEIEARKVIIHDFEITRIQLPEVDFKVRCSKGTYIRSLANDFGKALDNGAHLSGLRRTKIGDFSVENAYSPEGFETFLGLKNY